MLASLTSGRISLFDTTSDFQCSSSVLSRGIVLNVAWNTQSNKAICCDDYGELLLVETEKFVLDRKWLAHKSKYGLVGSFSYYFSYLFFNLKQLFLVIL